MGTSCFPNQQETILKELVQGQEFASQLQLLFKTQSTHDGDLHFYPPITTELLGKISRSFTDAISALNNGSSENIQATSHGEQQSSAGSRPFEEDSGESRKRPLPPVGKSGAAAGERDNRGSYKRRKSGNSHIIVSSSLTQDGHAWRKYGQKEILHAKFPRSYFRCTHKFEQGCKAKKQVQRLEQEKEMYSITYLGQHTCRNAPRAALPPVVDTTTTAVVVGEPSAVTANVKKEVCTVSKDDGNNSMNEQSPSGVTVDHQMVENDGNANMWQDLASFGVEAEGAVSNYEYGFGNYNYCGHDGASDTQMLDLDFAVNDIDFEDGFRFDPEQRGGFFL